ncbi:MAG: 2-succinyl-6-hydroxy-2,4-cyclohexadiene-1-carboxylate synthase [Thalassolituus oleivorans]|jgi:2-succinyl-6-hydroxy-2,4-cyclohexadiene-1-carboxylate synthase
MAGLNCRHWGTQGAPCIVLLHGFMGTGADWEAVARQLIPEFQVLAPDLPGHGASTGRSEAEYTLFGAAEAVLQTVGTFVAESPVLGGYSLGGRVALHAAFGASRLAPPPGQGWVAGLGLVSAHTGLPEADRKNRIRVDTDRARDLEADYAAFLDTWLRLPLIRTLSANKRQGLTARRLETGTPVELARALTGMSTGLQDDYGHRVASPHVPVSFCAGAADTPYAELAQLLGRMGAQVPDTPGDGLHVTIHPGAGHNLPLESPDFVAGQLRALCRRAFANRNRLPYIR